MKVIYYYHIPKCGGTYVYRLAQKICKEIDAEFVPFINLDRNKKNSNLDKELKEFIGSIKDFSKKEVLFIHHHHGYPGIHELYDEILKAKAAVSEKGGKMMVVTSIRDPLSFSISKVNYLQKGGCNIKYEHLIDQSSNHNMISKYLLYNHNKRWKDESLHIDISSLEKNLFIFDRIFLTEKMEGLTDFLNDFVGTKNINIKEKINKGNLKYLPTEEEKNKILEVNQLDQHFYDLIKENESKGVQLKWNSILFFKKSATDFLKKIIG